MTDHVLLPEPIRREDIGAVIGWKFDHQSGMSTRDGIITEFPGGLPSEADQDAWVIEYEGRDIVAEEAAIIDSRIDADPLLLAFEAELANANGIDTATQRANIKARLP